MVQNAASYDELGVPIGVQFENLAFKVNASALFDTMTGTCTGEQMLERLGCERGQRGAVNLKRNFWNLE